MDELIVNVPIAAAIITTIVIFMNYIKGRDIEFKEVIEKSNEIHGRNVRCLEEVTRLLRKLNGKN